MLLLSNARVLLDHDTSPAVTWATQRNPWVPNDIASFLRFEGLSSGLFLSVTNPWSSIGFSDEHDACLTFQNRSYVVADAVTDAVADAVADAVDDAVADTAASSVSAFDCLTSPPPLPSSPFNDLPNMPINVPDTATCQLQCAADANCSAYVVSPPPRVSLSRVVT